MSHIIEQIQEVMPSALEGKVVQTLGMTVAVAGFPAPVGAMATIELPQGKLLEGEVIGFQNELTLLYPYSEMQGVRHGSPVRLKRTASWLSVGPELLGRVVDAHGRAIDGGPQPVMGTRVRLHRRPPEPVERPKIDTALGTGIRSIDGLLTCGRGQRLGIFAGSGVGKSVSLGMMARYTAADVTVVALIGERGREIRSFIEDDLGPRGLERSVLVVATSDEPPVIRVRAALAATAIAEYFRDAGKDVLLIMDSLTRFAHAQREIGLSAGEPPTTRGYPPSVFSLLPKLVERAGRSAVGSITAFYSVLVEADDPNEPIADAVRGLLDGHIWLSRKLASRGQYPAVDVLESLSRLMPQVTNTEQQQAAIAVRELMAAYRDHEDLISIGAYRRGANPRVDLAMDVQNDLATYLKQKIDEEVSFETARTQLLQLIQAMSQKRQASLTAARPQTKGTMPS